MKKGASAPFFVICNVLLFYRIGLIFYRVAIGVASLTNAKAKQWVVGRRGVFERLTKELNNRKSEDVVWMHCASLGEFEQGRPVLEGIKFKFPDTRVLLTFFSPSGYEIRKNYELADWVCYLPLDSPMNAKRFIDIVQPRLTIFVKYEFWYYYLLELQKRQSAILSISTILREEQAYFKASGSFFKPILRGFDHYFVQTEKTKLLLKSIGVDQSTVAGDTRFDRVVEIAKKTEGNKLVEKFLGKNNTFVLGSTWEQDLDFFDSFIKDNRMGFKFVIAPHEVGLNNINRIKERFSGKSVLLSETSDMEDVSHFEILIIDCIGLLSSLYKYADYVYVGGGFGSGLHNTLEAAVFGKPIFIAPKYDKFQEAVDLVRIGGAFAVATSIEMEVLLNDFINDSKTYELACMASKNYVTDNAGATDIIVDYCQKWLEA